MTHQLEDIGNSAEYSPLHDIETEASWGTHDIFWVSYSKNVILPGGHTPRIEEPGPLSHFLLIWGPYLSNHQLQAVFRSFSGCVPTIGQEFWHWTGICAGSRGVLWHSLWSMPKRVI